MTKNSKTPGANQILADEAGASLTIDLNALASNWQALRECAGTETSAVVKADAYGTGIEQAVPALARVGCSTFFVAHLSEAKRVRAIAPDAVIYVLNGFLPGTGEIYARFDLRPVLGSHPEISEWSAFSRAQGGKLKAALHVDTGMNRLGLNVSDGIALKSDDRLEGFTPSLLMSHLVMAEEADAPINRRQIDAFLSLKAALPSIPTSLANSSGVFLKDMPRFDLARPGYALYGGNPTPTQENPMKPVVRLEATIIETRWVDSGETAGYSAAWTAKGRRRLATISVGYADGYPRSGGSTTDTIGQKGIGLINGVSCPFVGRISMDLIILDVTDVKAERGTPVTLIGDNLSVDEVGARAGTIGYEILTNLGRRYSRSYVGGA